MWDNTDNHSGTCRDNTGAASSTCSLDSNGETYKAQEQLVCVDPSDPSYCATAS